MAGVTAQEFQDRLEENEARMGEMAAFAVTCEQLGIDEDDAYELLALAEEARS